jgi:hypothetical protein
MTPKTLVQTLVEIYGRIGDFHITPCDGAIPISEADRLAEKAVEDYTTDAIGKAQAEIERLRSLIYLYVDPFDVTPEDEEFVRAAVNAVLQEYRK